MKEQKYSVNQHLLETILVWVKSGEIAIPEIQRPFVWDAVQVRDLMDSLYQGYPVGYLIAWRNPTVRLKDGTRSEGKKILIDGQQRVTALMAAVLGHSVLTKDYKRVRIRIAFHPHDERFEVCNSAIEKDSAWIPDMAPLVNGERGLIKSVRDYCEANPGCDPDQIEVAITNLMQISKKQIGFIELAADLDIETVTEIFIRINSKGVVLSQADFAMSKIAASEQYGGPTLRKAIDYFCHLAVAPEFYNTIVDVDQEFASTDLFRKMAWMRQENDELYDPAYTDMLRVAFASEFERGRLQDLVSLLSGRNFETRQYEEDIAAASFRRLQTGVERFINETHFKRFLMIVRSAGFIEASLVRSQNVLNFAYTLYLKLRVQGYEPNMIEHYVRRWLVLSMLTGRYSGASETQFDYDIRQIAHRDFGEFLRDVEAAELSDAFWTVALLQHLNTSVASSPYLHVFWAAQVSADDRGFLSQEIRVRDLITHRGDIHHIFPRDYLKQYARNRGQYNQIANYVYTQSEINIRIGKASPGEYMQEVLAQCNGGPVRYGGITNLAQLWQNLAANSIPESVCTMTVDDYDDFLEERRYLMAQKMRDYYGKL
jgi:hypothetical protein